VFRSSISCPSVAKHEWPLEQASNAYNSNDDFDRDYYIIMNARRHRDFVESRSGVLLCFCAICAHKLNSISPYHWNQQIFVTIIIQLLTYIQ
jgi:hypothetical protein